jgi:hypothetical protein
MAMQGDNAADEVADPAYWLVCGLEWASEGLTAEAAVAVAPGLVPRDVLSHHAYQVLGCADLYARKHGERVVFLSDLTRMFAMAGTSWAQLGVDWMAALQELRSGRFPAMFLTISERAYSLSCQPAAGSSAAYLGSDDAEAGERQLARQAVARQLAADWPAYVRSMIESGRIGRIG